ncbi:hypothetical protein [Roseibium sp. SCP14]|uniref:hypothetical protein n=1 Tax=Roseibium sp. SCP14 TaxID=3141375 RepID=UPI003336B382
MNRNNLTALFLPIASMALFATSAIASETGAHEQTVSWWTPPGETDTTAFSALVLLFLLLFAVFHFYARFDRFAERHNEGTPLQTTIPMLLMIAFAYEIFPPLSHFSILLPLALIATALARDLMLWFEPMKEHTLKGELEGVLLEELQHEHLGEHDRYGRRVQPEKPSPDTEPNRPAQAATAASSDPVRRVSPSASQSQVVQAKEGAGND